MKGKLYKKLLKNLEENEKDKKKDFQLEKRFFFCQEMNEILVLLVEYFL